VRGGGEKGGAIIAKIIGCGGKISGRNER